MFWVAGMNKAGAFGDTVSWLGIEAEVAGRVSLDYAIARRYRSRRAAPGEAGAAAPDAGPV
jgi:hypothetical protein